VAINHNGILPDCNTVITSLIQSLIDKGFLDFGYEILDEYFGKKYISSINVRGASRSESKIVKSRKNPVS
jgi:hypothetical protein